MKWLLNQILIISGLLIIFFALIFIFTFLKHFTDLEIANTKDASEVFNNLLTPILTALGAYLVYTTFRQQGETNKINDNRYNIDKGYNQILIYLEEVEKFKSYIVLIDNTNIEHKQEKATAFYANYLFYKSQYEPLTPKEYNTIRNMAEFYHLFLEYLQIVELTANNLIDFHKLQDKSFLILRKKFHKDTNSLRGVMATILNCQIDNNNVEFYHYIRIFTQVNRTNNACLAVYNLGYEGEVKIF
jgi:hypothetical protein